MLNFSLSKQEKQLFESDPEDDIALANFLDDVEDNLPLSKLLVSN